MRRSSRSVPTDWRYEQPSQSEGTSSRLESSPPRITQAQRGRSSSPASRSVREIFPTASRDPSSELQRAFSSRLDSRVAYQSHTDNLPATGFSSLPLIRNHEDILYTSKDTLVNLAGGYSGYKPAYVVKLDLFAVYAELILNAPLDQWLDVNFRTPVRAGKPNCQGPPLITTLLHLKDIIDWLEHEELFTCYLVQVCDWSSEGSSPETRGSTEYISNFREDTRVQRIRTFRSCEEAAVSVYLDGLLQGISSIFGCLALDATKVDESVYAEIKAQCNQQMADYRDIVVREVGQRLFIF